MQFRRDIKTINSDKESECDTIMRLYSYTCDKKDKGSYFVEWNYRLENYINDKYKTKKETWKFEFNYPCSGCDCNCSYAIVRRHIKSKTDPMDKPETMYFNYYPGTKKFFFDSSIYYFLYKYRENVVKKEIEKCWNCLDFLKNYKKVYNYQMDMKIIIFGIE